MSLCVWKIHTHECTQLLQDGFIALGLADGFCGCGHWSVCSLWPTFNIRTQTHRYTHTHTFPASLCICFSPHSWACCAQRGPANEKDTDTLALTLSYFILCVLPEDWFVLCQSETLDLNWLDLIRIPHREISFAFSCHCKCCTCRRHGTCSPDRTVGTSRGRVSATCCCCLNPEVGSNRVRILCYCP